MYKIPAGFEYTGEPSLNARDYFAAKIVPMFLNQQRRPYEEYNYRNAAVQAYKMADIMLKVREEK